MAGETQDQSFDPSQDQDFLKAPPERQHAYLTSVDPDYAKAPPERQRAYLDHVNGTHYTETGGTNRPVAPLPPNPILAARPGGEEVHGGGATSPTNIPAESERPKREALVREAGSPAAVPLAVGARALETIARNREQENLRNAATGKPRQARIPDEANIALPENASVPTEDRLTPFLARTGADILRGIAGTQTPTSLGIAAAAPAAPTLIGTALAAHGGINAAENAPAAFRGDPEAAQRALNAAAEATGGAALAGQGIAEPTPLERGAANLAKRTFESAGGLKTLGIIKPEPEQALTRAIQPGVNIPRAQESIPIAGARLQQVKNAGLVMDEDGNPVTEFKSNKDILAGVRAAKNYVWDALEKRTGSVAELQTDTSGAADAMEQSISKRTREQYPGIAKRIEERADTYRGLKSFRDIEEAIQDANNDLRNFYKRASPTDSPITAETAATEAEVKYLRNLLDEKVEALTGSGTKELKREYGALRDVERAAARQYAVETRQKGATLWEGLAALRAAGDFVSGNVLGAAKGAATIAVGRRLANVRSPQWNIDQAFQGPKAFKPAAEIAPPPGVNIRGALPPKGGTGPATPGTSAMTLHPVPGERFNPETGPNAPPIDVEFRDINGVRPGPTSMPGERPNRVIVTPRPGVEIEPNAPELPRGPNEPPQLSGEALRKALPAARQIQVGPSSLPPEPPPTPKPTQGKLDFSKAVSAARGEEAPVPRTERRQAANMAERQRVSEMTPEEMRQELLTSKVTNLPNRRAFDEAGKSKAVGMSDADGLKALNDRFGYEAGNELLRAKAEALKEAGLDAYHDKGDEFLYRGESAADLRQKLERAREILKNKTIEVTMTDGSTRRFKGADFSYGNGKNLSEAEQGLKANKTEREGRGERARGELRGIVETQPEKGEVNQGAQKLAPEPGKMPPAPTEARKPSEPIFKPIENPRERVNPAGMPTRGGRAAREQLETFEPETLEEAKEQIEAMADMWRTFERPGRYIHDVGYEPGDKNPGKPENVAIGIKSARPQMEDAFPWLKNLPKVTEGKLRAAAISQKGVEYTRLLNEAGRHIQAAKVAAGPILDEYGGQLEEAAKSVESIDPDLAATLRATAQGKFSGMSALRSFIKERLNDARSAAEFDKAIGELSREELSEGTEEHHREGPQPREETGQANVMPPAGGVLPGMERAVTEQKEAAGRFQGEELTKAMREAGKNISAATGELETKSPLFRGTEASPQREIFGPKKKKQGEK